MIELLISFALISVALFCLNQKQHFQMISETAANMVSSLHHCLTLFHQQEEVRILQLKEEKEKCRVLEESLNVLAKEHHQLEQSVASHLSEKGGQSMKHFLQSNDDDEFHDAFHDAGIIFFFQKTSMDSTLPCFLIFSISQENNFSICFDNLSDSDDDDDDTLMTASVFNSPTESLQDLRSIPIAPYERLSYNSQHDSFHTAADDQEFERDAAAAAAAATGATGSMHNSDDEEDSDDTLVDGVSIASSCNTYISEGGDAYKCARDEFFFRPKPQQTEHELIDFSEVACEMPESVGVVHRGKSCSR